MTTIPDDLPLERDLACLNCGYNLRSRRPSQYCPECNVSIAASIDLERRRKSALPYPRSLAAACWTFVVAIAFFGLYNVVWFGAAGLNRWRSPLSSRVSMVLELTTFFGKQLFAVAAIMLYAANAAGPNTSRWPRRGLLVSALVAAVLDAAAWLAWLAIPRAARPSYYFLAMDIAGYCQVAALLAFFFFALLHARQVFRQLDLPRYQLLAILLLAAACAERILALVIQVARHYRAFATYEHYLNTVIVHSLLEAAVHIAMIACLLKAAGALASLIVVPLWTPDPARRPAAPAGGE